MRLGTTLLRAVVGGLFVGHGLQKLKGWFGGHGPEATAQMFEGLGLRPGKHHAIAAGTAETAGGALLATGLATPVAASMLTGTMITAIAKVHGSKGLWNTGGGFEYNLVLLAAIAAIADDDSGPVVAGLSLAAGAAGAGAAMAIGSRWPEATPEPEPDPEPSEQEPYRPRFAERGEAEVEADAEARQAQSS
jgi:putative oxidoreductase